MKVRNFAEWATVVYEGKNPTESSNFYFYDKGDSDPRSLFECLIGSVDSSVNEALEKLDFDFCEADRVLVSSIAETLRTGNEEPLNEMFDSVKKAIKNTLDGAKELINKGVQIGAEMYTSVKEIAGKIKEAVSKVYENVRKFLGEAWKTVKSKGKSSVEKVKNFVAKDLSATAISSLSTVLQSKSAESEFEQVPKDLKGAAGKISGKTINLDPSEAEDALKKSAEELEDSDSKEVSDIVIGDLVEIGESAVNDMVTSIKGVLLEGYNMEDLLEYMENGESTLKEEHSNKRSLLGWMIEAIGFAMAPFAKLYEFAVEATTNGIMIVISSVARGVKNAYKYVVLGTICSLVFHILHAIPGIEKHIEHMAASHESLVNEAFSVKLADRKVHMVSDEDLYNVGKIAVGSIFAAAMKHFFPAVGLILEIFITAFAAYELGIAFCNFSEKHMELGACKIIMKAEHGLEKLLG